MEFTHNVNKLGNSRDLDLSCKGPTTPKSLQLQKNLPKQTVFCVYMHNIIIKIVEHLELFGGTPRCVQRTATCSPANTFVPVSKWCQVVVKVEIYDHVKDPVTQDLVQSLFFYVTISAIYGILPPLEHWP